MNAVATFDSSEFSHKKVTYLWKYEHKKKSDKLQSFCFIKKLKIRIFIKLHIFTWWIGILFLNTYPHPLTPNSQYSISHPLV